MDNNQNQSNINSNSKNYIWDESGLEVFKTLCPLSEFNSQWQFNPDFLHMGYFNLKNKKEVTLKALISKKQISKYIESGGQFCINIDKSAYHLNPNGRCRIVNTDVFYDLNEISDTSQTHIINNKVLENYLFGDKTKPSEKECLKYYKMYRSKDKQSSKLAEHIIFSLHTDFNWLKSLCTKNYILNELQKYCYIFSVKPQFNSSNIFNYFKYSDSYNFSDTLAYHLELTWKTKFKVTQSPFKIETI